MRKVSQEAIAQAVEVIRSEDGIAPRVAIAGDLILDRYVMGTVSRISPEAPVPVFDVVEEYYRPGGAGNVAMNCRDLGANEWLYAAFSGTYTWREIAAIDRRYVSHYLASSSKPPIMKTRYMAGQHQLLRVDRDYGVELCENSRNAFLCNINGISNLTLIISDYNKGTLDGMREDIVRIAKKQNCLVLVDSKSPTWSFYTRSDVFMPNRKEFEAVRGKCRDLQHIADEAEITKDFETIIVTLGSDGMLLCQKGQEPVHIEATARAVFDVCGAGDTAIAALAVLLQLGCGMEAATWGANLAAGIKVEKIGTATVTREEWRKACNETHT
jgi:D-beta-D-heptose 7-phosphate kinase/D-beta-D-heptose 1-phosphate adenosyltransferase